MRKTGLNHTISSERGERVNGFMRTKHKNSKEYISLRGIRIAEAIRLKMWCIQKPEIRSTKDMTRYTNALPKESRLESDFHTSDSHPLICRWPS